jgi:hypothetical protein
MVERPTAIGQLMFGQPGQAAEDGFLRAVTLSELRQGDLLSAA